MNSPDAQESFSVGKVVAAVLIPTTFVGVLAFALWPRGEALGTIDLKAGDGSLAIEAKRGATLHFRLDATPGNKAALRHLERSTIAVALEEEGKSRTAQCKAYAGRAVSTGSSAGGIVLDCDIPMQTTGRATVRAKATWVSGFSPSAATLEVRRSDP